MFQTGNLVGESVLHKQSGVRLYDGDSRSKFDDGDLDLTSHRIIWRNNSIKIQLLLEKVIFLEKEEGGFMRSDKITVHVSPLTEFELQLARPVESSKANFIKLSFRSGGQSQAHKHLQEAFTKKAWSVDNSNVGASGARAALSKPVKKEIRSGIGGIEKKLSQKAKQDQANISQAFQDLNKLMEMAKPMVVLAKSISVKIRDKQGEISEDETIQFKSYLLSLGVDDPVTKDSAGSDKKYYQGLAREMFLVLDQPIQEAGGMMTLTDAFCRINRARGLELISPEDLLYASQALRDVNLPMKLHTFDTGVKVLQSSSHSEEEIVQSTINLVESAGNLTPEQLSKSLNLSVILAQERLLSAEREGKLCRDDSVEGLRFFPNEFLNRED